MTMDTTAASSSLHLHVDPFSGAAGDMLLASCLDASPDPAALLHYVNASLKNGMPEIADEFDVRMEKVWRGGMGSIAGRRVVVWSKWGDRMAPVPKKGKGSDSSGVGAGGGDGMGLGVTAKETVVRNGTTTHMAMAAKETVVRNGTTTHMAMAAKETVVRNGTTTHMAMAAKETVVRTARPLTWP